MRPYRKVKGISLEATSLDFCLNTYFKYRFSIFVLKPLKLEFVVVSVFTLLNGPVINKYQEELKK